MTIAALPGGSNRGPGGPDATVPGDIVGTTIQTGDDDPVVSSFPPSVRTGPAPGASAA